MRYIDTTHINTPPNWLDLAKQALGDNYPSLWTYFKRDFEDIIGKKCWYSESDNSGSINPIDHYRPKANNVKALPPKYKKIFDSINHAIWGQLNSQSRNGYSFLTYSFNNYRYCCDIVNSETNSIGDNIARGKSNYFPLKHDSSIAINHAQIVNEAPCLLDPCYQFDVEYLKFNRLGLIDAQKGILAGSWEHCRVNVSIEIYHLHYEIFVEKRKELWVECEKHIKLAYLYKDTPRTEDQEEHFVYHLKALATKINKKYPFSAVAIDCIRTYKERPEYDWLDGYFPNNRLIK